MAVRELQEQQWGRNNEEVKRRILDKIGKEVSFRFPRGESGMRGTLTDRAVISCDYDTNGIGYWDIVDLVSFPSEEEYWMRIGYYRVKEGQLRWGSQTTIAEPLSQWKRILVHTAHEKEWFKKLLKEVCEEL